MEMQVRGRGVAGVPQLAEDLSSLDVLSDGNVDGGRLQMGIKREGAPAEIEDDVVAIDVFERDGAHVGQDARGLLLEPIENGHDLAVGYGNDVRSVGGIAMKIGFGSVQQAPFVIKAHPVDGEALAEIDAAVDGLAGGAVCAADLTASVKS